MNIAVSKTEIIRCVDDLGRVAIPKEIRQTMGIQKGDTMEIFTSKEGGVYFQVYRPNTPQAKAEIAKDFLNKYLKHIYNQYQAKFSIENNTTKCEIIYDNVRCTGIAKRNPEDEYDINVGIVISFCRAASWTIPDGLL